jgi:hypothetical protein
MRNIQGLTRAIFGSITLILATPSFGANVYKWVDDQGQTHFSESPPKTEQKSELLKIQKPSIIAKPVQIPTQSNEISPEEKLLRKQEALQAEKNKKSCDQAQARLAILQSGRRIKKENYDFMTDEERATETKLSQQIIDSLCLIEK